MTRPTLGCGETSDVIERAIVVVIDPVSDPIAGTVDDGSGDSTAFVGYAHLVAAIELHRKLAGGPGGQQAKHDLARDPDDLRRP